MRYFEDIRAGDSFDLGSVTVTQEEILEFAARYDPQVFHTDPERARDSAFGGLVASGWHTTSLYMRLLVDGFLGDTASLGAGGVDELRWARPVRPGDTLHARLTVHDARLSRSRPDRGILQLYAEVTNQDGDVVLNLRSANFVARRPT